MLVRIKLISEPSDEDFQLVGYADEIPELGHSMNLWWEQKGVVVRLRSGTVIKMVDSSGHGYKSWDVTTDNGMVYHVLILSQRMVDEIGIKGVLG